MLYNILDTAENTDGDLQMGDHLDDIVKKLYNRRFARFCADNGVRVALLFGSVAGGEAGPESDIDLALLLEKQFAPRDSLASGRLKRRLVRELSGFLETSRIDLVLLNYATPLLRFQAARTGKLIYQKNSVDYAGFASLALRQHNDAGIFYRLEADYLNRP